MSTPAPRRLALYGGLNLGFMLMVGLGMGIGGGSNPRLLHLVLLFALCSTPVIDIDRINGPFALMGMFMSVYFVSYGVGDLTELFMGKSSSPTTEVLSETEVLIFAAGVLWVLFYRLAAHYAKPRSTTSIPCDWSKATVLIVGPILWAVGTYATILWSVYIVPDTTNEAFKKGINSIGTFAASANILGQMMQPLGMLLLAYALYAFRGWYLLPVVIAMVIFQVALGFVVDIKGMAMIGGVLVIVTCVLVTGRVPKAWLAAGVLFVIFVYPIFTAYRTAIHGDLGLARTAVIASFGNVLQKTLAAEEKVNSGRERAQTFFERSSLKGSTEMIVEKTGNGVEFQRGHTLTPILAAFIPKIIWSDKYDVPTGQLVNKQFHVSDSDDVFISPSHLGELYWNFGWPGAMLGMSLIGLICGYVGARCNMGEVATVTRLLVLLLTIKQLIVGFEGAVGSSYVVWLRSIAAIGILHLLFARVPAAARASLRTERTGQRPPSVPPKGPLFGNLLN